MADLYTNIETILKERKISLHKLSEISGVPYTCLCNVKSGRNKSMSAKNLSLLSSALNVRIEELTEGTKKESASADPRIDEIVKSLNTLSDAQLDKLLDYLQFLTFEKNQ